VKLLSKIKKLFSWFFKKPTRGRTENITMILKIRKYIIILMLIGLIVFFPLVIDQRIQSLHNKNVIFYKVDKIPSRYVGLVLGAAVWSGFPSPILKDRLDSAVKLYKNKKINKILVSGDHGSVYYDEVNIMGIYLVKNGVRKRDIFLDHAGFRTFDSMYRAKSIFLVGDAIIITQEFHLPRAIYLARELGIESVGFAADRRIYKERFYYRLREFFARVKAWLDVNILNTRPKYLGESIPITGTSLRSWESRKKK
jgi:SanA protein